MCVGAIDSLAIQSLNIVVALVIMHSSVSFGGRDCGVRVRTWPAARTSNPGMKRTRDAFQPRQPQMSARRKHHHVYLTLKGDGLVIRWL